MIFYLNLIARLVLAGILGGIIGYEREYTNRPAGFRTHILVCVGSALVMVTSEFIYRRYSGTANIDPARLGAQVISGIGFLGAGTIIREGASVRGLTTAASLWAVSAVGIAAGIGFYEGAITATALIFITLIVLKKTERHFAKKRRYKIIYIESGNIPGQLVTVSSILEKNNIIVRNIEFVSSEDDENMLIRLLIRVPGRSVNNNFITELQKVEGIQKVYEE
jgi:putative Mg2+ transporter-C (MgtC) family protein